MLISPTMSLSDLIPLMGERFGVNHPSRQASDEEASDLRDILVRDYIGMDTNDIPGAKWHIMCLAVDPNQQ